MTCTTTSDSDYQSDAWCVDGLGPLGPLGPHELVTNGIEPIEDERHLLVIEISPTKIDLAGNQL